MTIICTEQQKKEIIHSQFCPVSKCQFYSREQGSKYETCEQCREDTIEWIIERPKGKWIYQPNHTHLDNVQKYHCSTNKCGWQQNYKSNFCPNCGADMRGEEE